MTAEANVLVQIDWSSSASLEEDRPGGRISKIRKQSPKKAAEIIDSFFISLPEILLSTVSTLFRSVRSEGSFLCIVPPTDALGVSTWIENLFRGMGATWHNGIDLRVSAV